MNSVFERTIKKLPYLRPFLRERDVQEQAKEVHERDIQEQAKGLNDLLFSDTRNIPKDSLAEFSSLLLDSCKRRGYTPEFTERWMSHVHRLYFSSQWLGNILLSFGGQVSALELGDVSPFTDVVSHCFPQVRLKFFKGDLRARWEAEDSSHDLIICTEVLEHLNDPPTGVQDTFYGTGLTAALRECFRVLKPNGRLFITTPNGASIFHLRALLFGWPARYYHLHVREYTIHELWPQLTALGFAIERNQTLHCLTIEHPMDYSPVFAALLHYQFETGDRGDDLFIVARKP